MNRDPAVPAANRTTAVIAYVAVLAKVNLWPVPDVALVTAADAVSVVPNPTTVSVPFGID